MRDDLELPKPAFSAPQAMGPEWQRKGDRACPSLDTGNTTGAPA